MFADGVSSGSEQYAGYIEYNHSVDRMRLKSNGDFLVYGASLGADALVVKSAGNVGINQPSPAAKLDIKGDTTTYAGMAKIYLTDSNSNSESRNWSIGNGGSGYGHFTIGLSNAKDGDPQASGTHTNPFIIDHVGNVGIGGANPTLGAKLEVQHNTWSSGAPYGALTLSLIHI